MSGEAQADGDFAGEGSDTAAIAEAALLWRRPRFAKRERVVRIVEYSRYPRSARDEQRRVGFTRDESRTGLCLTAKHSEQKGTLLRVAVRDADGGCLLDALARVVWCGARGDGSFWIGLALLDLAAAAEPARPRVRSVRRERPGDEIAMTA